MGRVGNRAFNHRVAPSAAEARVRRGRLELRWAGVWILGAVLALAACAGPGDAAEVTGDVAAELSTAIARDTETLHERLQTIHESMLRMRAADTLAVAKLEAERVVNLIVGPDGRHAGDLNADGQVSGLAATGVLPVDGRSAEHPGLGLALYDAPGAKAELRAALAGIVIGNADGWRNPATRYDEIDRAVEITANSANAVGDMDGHLMRSLAWALLALRSDELSVALEYAGHGQIHTALSLRAIAREVEAGKAASG